MPNPVITGSIDRLASGQSLGADEAARVLREIMEGQASQAETAAFLIALRTKGETVAEIVGLARTMRELALKVDARRDDLLDTAGTGGGQPTFNVSTTAAFVAAAAGCPVAKHGNRSATGQCGSADVLEALGARIDLDPGAIAECIESIGFGFMFAPLHHAAMKHVVPVRKELGVRTIFNFLGPLTNPAGATRQLIGVSDAAYLDTIAAALHELGGRSALVVSSEDGLDEFSVSGVTRVAELRDGAIETYAVTPEEVGVEPAPVESFRAGTPARNAELARHVLAGRPGPERSLTVLNAGAAVYVAGKAETIAAGARLAEEAIDSGAAREALERYVKRTNEVAAVGS
jgi:anthranilate phosphoribosyltransferase